MVCNVKALTTKPDNLSGMEPHDGGENCLQVVLLPQNGSRGPCTQEHTLHHAESCAWVGGNTGMWGNMLECNSTGQSVCLPCTRP